MSQSQAKSTGTIVELSLFRPKLNQKGSSPNWAKGFQAQIKPCWSRSKSS